jgi:hypothetical protein
MGKENRLRIMWPCFALAIWWSYSKLLDIRTAKM